MAMTVDPRELRREIERWTREHSGWENREYLGMSQIWRCPAELYDRMTEEQEAFGEAARYCYEGYLHERDLQARLEAMGVYRPGVELVAEWDKRYQGHTDGEVVQDGKTVLLEIKSTSWANYGEIKENNRALQAHYEQVQAYLTHGAWDEAMVLYKCRDTGEIWPVVVWAHGPTQERLEEKARRILAAVDGGVRPECECGRH